ncbi:MAG: cell wall-binding repeat-containing protein, partial [Clostridia bacterium]|nr:cell wall-binding repeat-containing protein [Clostridia bacterium]
PDTAAYLAKLKKAGSVKNAYVIGGEGVISNDMMNKAGNALGVTPTRVFGANRFATCVAVNEQFKDTLNGDMLCVATGMDFPDALAGGVYAAINKAPLFLVNGKLKTPQLTDDQKAFLKTKAASKITVFGGTGAVSDEFVKLIANAGV